MTVVLRTCPSCAYGHVYDAVGVKLLLPSGPTALLKTPSNRMSIEDIVSQTANNLTSNNWSAFDGLDSDILPERVQDGARPVHLHLPITLFYGSRCD